MLRATMLLMMRHPSRFHQISRLKNHTLRVLQFKEKQAGMTQIIRQLLQDLEVQGTLFKELLPIKKCDQQLSCYETLPLAVPKEVLIGYKVPDHLPGLHIEILLARRLAAFQQVPRWTVR